YFSINTCYDGTSRYVCWIDLFKSSCRNTCYSLWCDWFMADCLSGKYSCYCYYALGKELGTRCYLITLDLTRISTWIDISFNRNTTDRKYNHFLWRNLSLYMDCLPPREVIREM